MARSGQSQLRRRFSIHAARAGRLKRAGSEKPEMNLRSCSRGIYIANGQMLQDGPRPLWGEALGAANDAKMPRSWVATDKSEKLT
jgi:hypothetical protein